ncbi:16S rRNA (cytosine(967)-C(5))-methyltransferase RsmB [Clostridiaceae bacterium M8S5]|nr:16S rRNA (cytosine(967)-C(5))-methyltransferase RsmB [Clostridiaceae bacterium M8S5]
MKNNARYIAINILKNINEEKAYSNIEVNKNIKSAKNQLDEGLIREIVYGVIQNKIMIDYIISKFSKTKIKKIAPIVLEILRTGIYQIMFMDRVPDSASCNESVKIAKKLGHRAIPGFVNGVLRNVTRKKADILKDVENLKGIEYLNIKYSHPKWMVEYFIDEFGYDFTEELLKSNNNRPKLNIRVNTLKIDRKKLMELLREKDFIVNKAPYSKYGIEIENPKNITSLQEYKNGYFSVQDQSSMLVAEIMSPKPESFVIDLCSAPGGKTCHIAEIMKNKGVILARDIHEHKLELIDKTANRLGIDIIDTQLFSALEIDKAIMQKADYVLVDAPCSGLGLLRRKPEIRYRMNIDKIKELSQIQHDILINGSKYVKRGGTLIYSTCTISTIENLNVLNKFLNENKDFELEPFKKELSEKLKLKTNNGYVKLYPNINNTDGFFISKLKRKNI